MSPELFAQIDGDPLDAGHGTSPKKSAAPRLGRDQKRNEEGDQLLTHNPSFLSRNTLR